MPRKSKPKKETPVETVVHKSDKRTNIPTRELVDFVVAEEGEPYTLLYPRDVSLDPQLVWKGKDEQDRDDLEVPAVPIYIQEKIAPKALIENLRREKGRVEEDEQASLFQEFNGIEFEELIEFYEHEQNWSNRLILGDSLLVMTSLAEKEGLKGRVQTVYFDPPYGIKFRSNWQVSTRRHEVHDSTSDVTRQPEQVKAFRDTWELGIHSYLSYMRDRLACSRELLTETGSIFVQIGDDNVHLVRSLLDETFGADNFVRQISLGKTSGLESSYLNSVFDYLLWYAKDISQLKYRPLYKEKTVGEPGATKYKRVRLSDGTIRPATKEELASRMPSEDGAHFCTDGDLTSQGNPLYSFEYDGKTYSGTWKTTEEGLQRLGWAGRIYKARNSLRYLRLFDDFLATPMTNNWYEIGGIQSRSDPKIYTVQTPTNAIERCLLMTTDPGDLVLDPTCGSGTTAYVAECWGRRWITIDTSRVALALARTRLMAAKFPYYLLSDSQEGMQKESEIQGVPLPSPLPVFGGDIKRGFVYQRTLHIMLETIATDENIKEGMGKEELEAEITRNAEYELLYDKPYEDKKRIRVTGPLTVESLSPHRVLSTDEDLPSSETEAIELAGSSQFAAMVLENLKKAGVQNTIKQERLAFNRLEPYAGIYLQGEGEYTEIDTPKRVAVCIGPEHGTVGPELVKEAAKEAVKGIGFDLLVVCGFAFDPHVSEEAKQYGSLTVLMARMNPDLSMGDELLKKTGAGNLFMVFGEPDLKITAEEEDQFSVEIRGVDVYDPTTGEIRSHSTDDIACWFIDTDYNEESFFVRHAYFCGADEPYENLKKALKADIDEDAWQSLYSTRSRTFDRPSTGKIAVKIINHYGDEVLQVYEL